MPFPGRAAQQATHESDDQADLDAEAAYRPRQRARRPASSAESLPQYVLKAAIFVLAMAVLAYLLIQLGQLGQQSQPVPPIAPTAAVPAQPPNGSALTSQGQVQPVGQGELRSTSRVLEPTYTVVAGDTLGSIAARFGTNVEALQSINNLPDRNVLSVGQKLVIPNQQ